MTANNAMSASAILVIDDERAFCDVVAEILRADGFDVRKAYNAVQGLKLLESFHPGLILMDIMMPDLDGISLIRKLRADGAHASIPIIVTSAKFMPQDRDEALEAGANAYLTKPFSADDLRKAIGSLIPA